MTPPPLDSTAVEAYRAAPKTGFLTGRLSYSTRRGAFSCRVVIITPAQQFFEWRLRRQAELFASNLRHGTDLDLPAALNVPMAVASQAECRSISGQEGVFAIRHLPVGVPMEVSTALDVQSDDGRRVRLFALSKPFKLSPNKPFVIHGPGDVTIVKRVPLP